jgi:hypothetical protein
MQIVERINKGICKIRKVKSFPSAMYSNWNCGQIAKESNKMNLKPFTSNPLKAKFIDKRKLEFINLIKKFDFPTWSQVYSSANYFKYSCRNLTFLKLAWNR